MAFLNCHTVVETIGGIATLRCTSQCVVSILWRVASSATKASPVRSSSQQPELTAVISSSNQAKSDGLIKKSVERTDSNCSGHLSFKMSPSVAHRRQERWGGEYPMWIIATVSLL